MEINRAYRALEQTAKNNHTSVEQVIQEINEAIAEAMNAPDPSAQTLWNAIPHAADRPSAAELVAYLGESIENDLKCWIFG